MSPFFANKTFHPCIGFEPAEPPPSNIKEVNGDAMALPTQDTWRSNDYVNAIGLVDDFMEWIGGLYKEGIC